MTVSRNVEKGFLNINPAFSGTEPSMVSGQIIILSLAWTSLE